MTSEQNETPDLEHVTQTTETPLGFNGPQRLDRVLGDFAAKWKPKPYIAPPPTPEEIAASEQEVRREANAARWRNWRNFTETIGPRYADVSFDNYVVSCPEQQVAVDKLQAYTDNAMENVKAGRGVIMVGPAGAGKDHLLIATVRSLIAKDFTAVWAQGADLFSEARDRIGDDNATEQELVDWFTATDILVLSDPIPPGSVITDFQRALLFRIIDYRYRFLRPTFVSLNVASGKEADDRLGAPLVDRLRHDAIAIKCSWVSHRTLLGDDE